MEADVLELDERAARALHAENRGLTGQRRAAVAGRQQRFGWGIAGVDSDGMPTSMRLMESRPRW